MIQKITPFLWFDGQAEDAANFYVSVFRNSKITNTSYYGDEGQDITGQKPGTVMVVDFEIEGQQFQAINGGPHFKFTPAISFVIECKDQEEVDYYWDKLTAGGKEVQCGWLEDKYGVSWQVVPASMAAIMRDPDKAKKERVMKAMFPMIKLDIAKLEEAARG